MSVEFWIEAERFYEFWFFIIGLFVLISVIIVIFIITYAKKENRKKYILIVSGLIAIAGTVGILGHFRYRPYLEQASYSNPLIRDREPRMMTYIYYGAVEQTNYSQLNYLDTLRNMVLYEEEKVTESITYLGQGDHFHYFEDPEGQIFKQNRKVDFNEVDQPAQIVGSQFTLKDTSFQEIGFKNLNKIMFDYIEIPASEQGKIYEPEDDFQIPKAEDQFRQWNF